MTCFFMARVNTRARLFVLTITTATTEGSHDKKDDHSVG